MSEAIEQSIQMEDFFATSLKDYEAFEEQSWSKGNGYVLPNYPMFTEKLEGLDSGLYLFAAESNMGKSAIMLNLIYDACMHKENNLFAIYYSLDDAKNEIIPRVIAMDQLIPIGVAAKPQRYQNKIDNAEENSDIYERMLNKRKAGLDKLKEQSNLFKIEDSSKIKCGEDMYEHMKMLRNYIKAFNPEANIIVGIDSISDVKFKNQRFSSGVEESTYVARTVKEWSNELSIPVFASIHLRKVNQNRRPTLDDLKDSNTYVYEASVVFLAFNDVSKNKQSAKIYYTEEGETIKCPVIELDWAKNKKSSFKGRTYNFFSPEYSYAKECEEDDMKRFDALVYTI